MDESQTKTLRENRVKIVNDLEPEGKVLDTLYEDGILTENDIELLSSAVTRKERCQLLLSILPTRGPLAYGSFQKALEVGQYDFLADVLSTGTHQTCKNTEVKTHIDTAHEKAYYKKQCKKCWPLIKNIKSEDTRPQDLIRIIEGHCCLLFDNIEPKDVIDQLFQDNVVTADDIDMVLTSTTRRGRCEKLFQILLCAKEDKVVESLKLSLMKKYSYIVETIKQVDFDNNKLPNYGVFENTKSDIDVRHGGTGSSEIPDNSYSCTNEDDICMAKLKISEYETDQKTSVKEFVTNGNKNDVKLTHHAADDVDGTLIVLESSKDRGRKNKPNVRFSNTSYKTNVSGKTEVLEKYKTPRTDKLTRNHKLKLKMENQQQDYDDKMMDHKEIVPMQMAAIQSQKPSRRLSVAFNYLSTLINQGEFTKFEDISLRLQTQFPTNFDLMCIIGYLHISRDLFKTDFDSAKSRIDKTMAILPQTSNPRYFMIELFTAKTRMYITQKKLQKLQTSLDVIKMNIATDPVGCTGRAAGWLFINEARSNTARISCLNLRNPNSYHMYEHLYESARSSFQRSMENFKRDGGKDGPFGFGFALCRLVVLMLRCGDNGLTMDTLTPSTDLIHSAGQYIKHLEDSDIEISKILDMHFRLAKCDYQFRRGNVVRALEHAQIAHHLATELRLLEFTEHAYNRVATLNSKTSIVHISDELTETDVHRILFEETSSSECDTTNNSIASSIRNNVLNAHCT